MRPVRLSAVLPYHAGFAFRNAKRLREKLVRI